jgi:alkylhydroperoxidase family enzyme
VAGDDIAWVNTAPGAGELAHILASHSLNPEALAAHVRLYRTIMFGDSPLTRTEREALAVAVSAANDCHY